MMRMKRLLVSVVATLGLSALGVSVANAGAAAPPSAGQEQLAAKGKSALTLVRWGGRGFRGGHWGGRRFAFAARPGWAGRRGYWGGGWRRAGWYGGWRRPVGWRGGWSRPVGWYGGGWGWPSYGWGW